VRNSSFSGPLSFRAIKVLTGHESDVADLQWSPNNRYLASCGLDSRVLIWDAKTYDRIAVIDRHTAFVKGITWDPAGKYLATQSDDKSVRVFRVADWEQETHITSNYVDASSSTFFQRLSWSPDGGLIATVNGESGGLCVAPIITRDSWASDISLVGHQAPIEVAVIYLDQDV
jgi:protein HIRA/HIR1